MDEAKRVLVVSDDVVLANEISARLETDGYDVMRCPGPMAPTYVCVGIRCDHCALVDAADVVVVDGWLASDQARAGTPSWHLARWYWKQGSAVVYLTGPDGLPAGITNDRIVALVRGAGTDDVSRVVHALAYGGSAPIGIRMHPFDGRSSETYLA